MEFQYVENKKKIYKKKKCDLSSLISWSLFSFGVQRSADFREYFRGFSAKFVLRVRVSRNGVTN